MSADLGLEELPSLCCGGETISVSRLMHYFPYSNDPDGGDGDPNTLGSSAVRTRGLLHSKGIETSFWGKFDRCLISHPVRAFISEVSPGLREVVLQTLLSDC